jgi:hypothetical protein
VSGRAEYARDRATHRWVVFEEQDA